MSAPLKVFSGECCLCDVGIPADAVDMNGKELHTGDIVHLWHVHYPGTDSEQWHTAGGLTAVVCHQYQSYSNGNVEMHSAHDAPFVMGIKAIAWSDPEWRVEIVKKFGDVIVGERWPAYGFSYGHSAAAESAKATGKQS